jgi:hypothetical protein
MTTKNIHSHRQSASSVYLTVSLKHCHSRVPIDIPFYLSLHTMPGIHFLLRQICYCATSSESLIALAFSLLILEGVRVRYRIYPILLNDGWAFSADASPLESECGLNIYYLPVSRKSGSKKGALLSLEDSFSCLADKFLLRGRLTSYALTSRLFALHFIHVRSSLIIQWR